MTKSSYKCRIPIFLKIVTFTSFTVHEIKGRFVFRKKDSEKNSRNDKITGPEKFSQNGIVISRKKLSSDETTVPLSFPEFFQSCCQFSKNKNKFESKPEIFGDFDGLKKSYLVNVCKGENSID